MNEADHVRKGLMQVLKTEGVVLNPDSRRFTVKIDRVRLQNRRNKDTTETNILEEILRTIGSESSIIGDPFWLQSWKDQSTAKFPSVGVSFAKEEDATKLLRMREIFIFGEASYSCSEKLRMVML